MLPQPVKTKGLFDLDVDDEIWQEIGLDVDEDRSIPAWLGNQDVRDGIKLRLELDRCQEEEMRLRRERTAMQEWAREEWACLAIAETKCGASAAGFMVWDLYSHRTALVTDADVLFLLQLRKVDLVQLCSVWQTDTRPVPADKVLGPSWGPTQEELHDAATCAVTGSWDAPVSSSGSSESDGDSDGDDSDFDTDLLDAVEFADSLDSHHHVL